MSKIIIFSKHFWPENFKINVIAKELVKRGHHITVITSKPNYNLKFRNTFKNKFFLEKKIWKGVNVYYIPVFIKKNYNWFSIFLNYLSHVISCFFYIHFFFKKKYDLIFVFGTSPIFQSLPAIYYSFMTKKPLVLWVQDLWPESLKDTGYVSNKYILSFIKNLVKINYIFSDLILVQSDNFKKKIKKDFNLKKKIETHYNLSELKFQRFKKSTNKKIVVTYAGNFGKAQDFETLLKVLKISKIRKNFYFKLIGSGKKFNYLREYIKNYNLQDCVNINKYLNENKLFKYLLESDALFLTLNKGEALSNTIPGKFQTYVSFGKPLIANSTGVSSKIILNSKIGYCNKPGDYNTLYNNLLKLKKMSLYEKRKIYKRCYLIYVKNFELKNNITKLENIFIKTIKNVT